MIENRGRDAAMRAQEPDPPLTPRQNVAWGAVLVTLGLGVAWLVFARPEQLRAPAWVAYTAAAAFLLAGCVLFATAARAPGVVDFLGVLTTTALVLPGGWIAFGSGARQCTASVPLPALVSDAVCRGVFGIGTVIGGGVVVLLARHALGRRR